MLLSLSCFHTSEAPCAKFFLFLSPRRTVVVVQGRVGWQVIVLGTYSWFLAWHTCPRGLCPSCSFNHKILLSRFWLWRIRWVPDLGYLCFFYSLYFSTKSIWKGFVYFCELLTDWCCILFGPSSDLILWGFVSVYAVIVGGLFDVHVHCISVLLFIWIWEDSCYLHSAVSTIVATLLFDWVPTVVQYWFTWVFVLIFINLGVDIIIY